MRNHGGLTSQCVFVLNHHIIPFKYIKMYFSIMCLKILSFHRQNSLIDSSSKRHKNSKSTMEACLTSLSVFEEIQFKIEKLCKFR